MNLDLAVVKDTPNRGNITATGPKLATEMLAKHVKEGPEGCQSSPVLLDAGLTSFFARGPGVKLAAASCRSISSSGLVTSHCG